MESRIGKKLMKKYVTQPANVVAGKITRGKAGKTGGGGETNQATGQWGGEIRGIHKNSARERSGPGRALGVTIFLGENNKGEG